jgi:hypothetical protein
MGALKFICPVTGNEVDTGLDLDAQRFAALPRDTTELSYPHCEKPHVLAGVSAFGSFDLKRSASSRLRARHQLALGGVMRSGGMTSTGLPSSSILVSTARACSGRVASSAPIGSIIRYAHASTNQRAGARRQDGSG